MATSKKKKESSNSNSGEFDWGAAAQPPQGPTASQSLLNLAMNGMPAYAPTYDANTMSMTDVLKELSPEYTKGFNAYRDEALRKGPSRWLNMSMANNALKMADAREKAKLETAGETASAMDNLAAMGGISSGARERIQEQGQKNAMSMSQDLTRQGNLADLNMGVQDETNRIGQLTNLTGMEDTKLKEWESAKQTDYTNISNERQRLNDYNLKKYQARMEALAAERQAQATENAGKK